MKSELRGRGRLCVTFPKPCGESREIGNRALPLEGCSVVPFGGQLLTCRQEIVRKHEEGISRRGLNGVGWVAKWDRL